MKKEWVWGAAGVILAAVLALGVGLGFTPPAARAMMVEHKVDVLEASSAVHDTKLAVHDTKLTDMGEDIRDIKHGIHQLLNRGR